MPPDIHAALSSAVAAATHLRDQIADIAHAVAQDDATAIVTAARALVARADRPAPPRHSFDRSEKESGSEQGESS